MRRFPSPQPTRNAVNTLTAMVKSPEVQNEPRSKRARDLLAQAKDFYQSKDYIPCLDRCELLAAGYGDLAESQEASKLATEIKNNPDWLQGACDLMGERLRGPYLPPPHSLLKRGAPPRPAY